MGTNEDLVSKLEWNNNIKNREEKEVLARKIASYVKNGDVVSFGSGTTSFLAVKEIGKRCRMEHLKITAIPTSEQISMLCDYLEIKTAELGDYKINWGFDGADEVDENNWLIKGLGGALYKEKRNLIQTPKVFILVDNTKIVSELGKKCPVPVECDMDKVEYVQTQLQKLGAVSCKIRTKVNSDEFFVSENRRYIVDAKFQKISMDLEKNINKIEGVLENGLFIGYDNIEIVTVTKNYINFIGERH